MPNRALVFCGFADIHLFLNNQPSTFIDEYNDFIMEIYPRMKYDKETWLKQKERYKRFLHEE